MDMAATSWPFTQISIHPSRVTGRRPEDHPSAALHGALQHDATQLRMSQRQLHGGTRSNGATEEDDTSRGFCRFSALENPLVSVYLLRGRYKGEILTQIWPIHLLHHFFSPPGMGHFNDP